MRQSARNSYLFSPGDFLDFILLFSALIMVICELNFFPQISADIFIPNSFFIFLRELDLFLVSFSRRFSQIFLSGTRFFIFVRELDLFLVPFSRRFPQNYFFLIVFFCVNLRDLRANFFSRKFYIYSIQK